MTKMAEGERELMDGLFRALELKTDDLRQLAEAAGLDPEWAYADVDMTDANLRGQDLRGMVLYIPDPSRVLMDEKTRLDLRTIAAMEPPEIDEEERRSAEMQAEELLGQNKPVPDSIAWKVRHISVSGVIGKHSPFADCHLLSNMPWLRRLNIAHTQVTDLSPLSGLTGLQWLDIEDTQITDLTPLSALTGLEWLDVSWTQIADLSPLSDLTGLRKLGVSHTQVSDLSPLSDLTGLEWLDVSWTQVADLSPLSGLTGLRELDVSRTPVSDLSPLSGIKHLRTLWARDTNVRDWSPVALVPMVIGRPDDWKKNKGSS